MRNRIDIRSAPCALPIQKALARCYEQNSATYISEGEPLRRMCWCYCRYNRGEHEFRSLSLTRRSSRLQRDWFRHGLCLMCLVLEKAGSSSVSWSNSPPQGPGDVLQTVFASNVGRRTVAGQISLRPMNPIFLIPALSACQDGHLLARRRRRLHCGCGDDRSRYSKTGCVSGT